MAAATIAQVVDYLVLVQVLVLGVVTDGKGLKVGFYESTCTNAESIIQEVMATVFKEALSLSGPLLSMHFHDCFVRGCEGSILLNSSTHTAEKDTPPNLSLRGFYVIDRVKAALKKKCPGIVSCADILAIITRDAAVESGGKFYNVEAIRLDEIMSIFLGRHTIGTSHCSSFSSRLYNFTGKNDSDPSMDPNYVKELKKKCKINDHITL